MRRTALEIVALGSTALFAGGAQAVAQNFAR